MSQRPIVQLLDLLGTKWVLRILWELNQGPCSFRELQSRCDDLSPTTINNRIKDLVAAGLVTKSDDVGYGLSSLGDELLEMFMPLYQFSGRWSEAVK